MRESELQTVKLSRKEWKRLRGTKYDPNNLVQVRIKMGMGVDYKPNRLYYADIYEDGIRIGGTIYPDKE